MITPSSSTINWENYVRGNKLNIKNFEVVFK